MILCDTGVMVSAINVRDRHHLRCLAVVRALRDRLVTTRPCITEAMHLLRKHDGAKGQGDLASWIEAGFVTSHLATELDDIRCCVLMRKYRDAPMDFADASLVVAAEALNITRILTLDSHFYAYRIHDRLPFEVLP